MNRQRLAQVATRIGIRKNAYSFGSGHPPNCYVLTLERGGWRYYVSDQGERTEELFFDTEDEACDHLLNALIRDPYTRQ
ncbi:MAG: hypothetical protein R2698_10680 [Microthrixaceae bacterium]